jgi:mannose-1-phosphate guanylyltransferase
MAVTDAMIVAGGRGTRLQPLTFTTPKPLVPFCGAPFLAGVIARLAGAGIQRVFLVVGADTEPFEVLRADAAAHGVTIELVPEPEPLDTAGGVRSALDRVDGAFLVLNGDVLTDVDLPAVIAAHEQVGADATIVLTRVDDTSSFGVCVREDWESDGEAGTRIVEFVEKPPPGTLPGQDAVNAGTYVLEPDALAAFAEGRLSFERAVFPGILERGGHIEGFVWEGVWADLGTPDRYRVGTHLALSGACRWPTVDAVADRGDGVRVHEDAEVADDVTFEGPVLVQPGAVIEPGATVGPGTVVGRDVHVARGAVVSRTVLFDRARIGTDVKADGLLAGFRARVETGASLGRDVVLGDGHRVTASDEVPDDARLPAPE